MHSHCLPVPVQLAVSAPAALPPFVSVFMSLPQAYAGYVEALTVDINWEWRGNNVETVISYIHGHNSNEASLQQSDTFFPDTFSLRL